MEGQAFVGTQPVVDLIKARNFDPMQVNSRIYSFLFIVFLSSASCSSQKKIERFSRSVLINRPGLVSASLGISIYDASKESFIYNYQSGKYFVPASNTKLFTLYAGLKYLGDSVVGIRYVERDNDLLLLPSGDPSLLHPDFRTQPVIDFLKQKRRNIYVAEANWKEQPLGPGWSWDDYNDDFMIERSPFPVYGNFIRWVQQKQQQGNQHGEFDASPSVFSLPDVNWKVHFDADSNSKHFYVKRNRDQNIFDISLGRKSGKHSGARKRNWNRFSPVLVCGRSRLFFPASFLIA